MEATNQDGEIVTLAEAINDLPQPRYWRRMEGVIEGDVGLEYEEAFLAAQLEIGPLIEADAENAFSKSKYTSLSRLLGDVMPILNKHFLTMRQGPGRLISHGAFDSPKRQLFLPVWTLLRHVKTGQWERVYIEMPLIKTDAQSVGSALTYGRRYLITGLFSLASTDDDGVRASHRPSLDNNPIEDAAAGMIEQIEACKSVQELKAWNAKNRQGLELLDDGIVERLREVYERHKAKVANAPQEPEKQKKANGKEVAHAS